MFTILFSIWNRNKYDQDKNHEFVQNHVLSHKKVKFQWSSMKNFNDLQWRHSIFIHFARLFCWTNVCCFLFSKCFYFWKKNTNICVFREIQQKKTQVLQIFPNFFNFFILVLIYVLRLFLICVIFRRLEHQCVCVFWGKGESTKY